MENSQRKLLEQQVSMLNSYIQQTALIMAMQPYDPRAVEASLKAIENHCAFMRQYSVTPRVSVTSREESIA